MMSMLAGSSVEALCKRAPGTGAPVEAITGGASLGAHMETYGFSAVPSLANKDPAQAIQDSGVSSIYDWVGLRARLHIYPHDLHGDT